MTFAAAGWVLGVVGLWLYSFTQIDLGLTLTRVSVWQGIQKAFQQIGYFNRPLSAELYLGILVTLFIFYFLLLRAVRAGRLGERQACQLILLTAVVLWFAYNAFSYDLFNYIFWGKIIVHYRQNPYLVKALDFPGDPMLGFMHWTHNVYPHGPVWLLFAAPLYALSFQKLLLAMVLMKGLAAGAYLLACRVISDLLAKISPRKRLFGLSIFAFSPLVVIEGLVSAHNDIVMMALVLLAFWLLMRRRFFWGWVVFGLSVGIKFATGLLLPVFLWVCWRTWRKQKVDFQKVWFSCLCLMAVALFLAIRRDELKPWYLLYLWPWVALLPQKRWLFWPVFGVSAGVLLHYAPYLYFGNWNPPVPAIKNYLTLVFLGLGMLLAITELLKLKSFHSSTRGSIK